MSHYDPSYFATEVVQNLSFPRLAGTESEQKAQRFLEHELDKLGIEHVRKESFTYSTVFMNVVLRVYDLVTGALMIAIFFLMFIPFYLLVLALSFILLIYTLFSRQIRDRLHFAVNALGKKHSSLNYIAELPPEGTPKGQTAEQNLILLVHYDSISHKLNPIFSGALYFFGLLGGTIYSFHAIGAVLLAASGVIEGINPWSFVYGVGLAVLLNIQLANRRGNASHGTLDNATGVANGLYLLDYFQHHPLQRTNLIVVFTGAEEVGDQGAHAFIERHYHELNLKSSFFLIVDSVGGNEQENLYFYGQGIPIRSFSPTIKAAIDRLLEQDKDRIYKLKSVYIPPLISYSTDHTPLKPNGYEFMIFGSNGSIHSDKDNVDHYYPELVENFYEFTRDLLLYMDRH